MTVDAWRDAVVADAEAHGLADVAPLLRSLSEMTRHLRSAEWNTDASGATEDAGRSAPPSRPVQS
jgi:hypothetical protein